MVYESDFYTTRRPYSSRPIVSSYSVTAPLRLIPGVPRFTTFVSPYDPYDTETTTTFRATSPIPFGIHKRLITGARITTTPSRVVISPVRITGSPVRIINTPIRVVRSPARIITSPARIVTVRSSYLRPSILNKEFDRIEHKYRSSPVSSYTEQYLQSPEYVNFDDIKREIRSSTAKLLKEVNKKVPRASTPKKEESKKWIYDPFANRQNSETYVANSILRPIRNVKRDIEAMSRYAAPASRYVGKSHLASTRIVGDRAYPKRKPRIYSCEDEKPKSPVDVLENYRKTRSAVATADIEEVKRRIRDYTQRYYYPYSTRCILQTFCNILRR
uniref:Uncharacterized protein n=1 Tax=Corethrella appendiculata TaxID=1370023 RepID=U5EPP6_9DIPT